MNKVIYYITMPYYILVFLASGIYHTIIGGAEGLRIAMFLNKLDLTPSEAKAAIDSMEFLQDHFCFTVKGGIYGRCRKKSCEGHRYVKNRTQYQFFKD